MANINVKYEAEVIVRWTDATGPMEARFGADVPWFTRLGILAMSNDDWGEIYLQNPGGEEFLWCSAKPEHREAARRAIGSLRGNQAIMPLREWTLAEVQEYRDTHAGHHPLADAMGDLYPNLDTLMTEAGMRAIQTARGPR